MACERMIPGGQNSNYGGGGDDRASRRVTDQDFESATKYEDAPELVLEILGKIRQVLILASRTSITLTFGNHYHFLYDFDGRCSEMG